MDKYTRNASAISSFNLLGWLRESRFFLTGSELREIRSLSETDGVLVPSAVARLQELALAVVARQTVGEG